MSQKRGQLTLFIVLGVVLVILFSTFFYVVNYTQESTIEPEVERFSDRNIKDVNLFVETCFDSKVKTGLDMLGKQGGYIEFPENFPFQETSGTYIPLHYDEGDDNLPSLEDMQNSLAGYINQGVFVCLNDFLFFKEKGIEFSAAVMTTEVIISESAVNIQLNYPVTITDKGGNIFKLASFNKNTPIKLKKMHEFAELVILAVKDYDESFEFFPDFIPNIQNYISYLAPELYLDPLPVPTSSHLFLWQIKGTAGNEEFNFIFGTKTSREMPH